MTNPPDDEYLQRLLPLRRRATASMSASEAKWLLRQLIHVASFTYAEAERWKTLACMRRGCSLA